MRDPDRVSSSPHDNEANNNYKSASPPPPLSLAMPGQATARALGIL